MGIVVFQHPEWALLRTLAWGALALGTASDYVMHARVRPKGWQLHRLILLVIWLYTLQECLLIGLSFSARSASHSADPRAAASAYRLFLSTIFFYHAADATFFLLLLLVAAGLWITRPSLSSGQAWAVSLLPLTYFITDLAVDFTVSREASRGHIRGRDEAQNLTFAGTSEGALELLALSSVINVSVLLATWVLIFDWSSKEMDRVNTELSDAADAEQRRLGGAAGAPVAPGSSDDHRGPLDTATPLQPLPPGRGAGIPSVTGSSDQPGGAPRPPLPSQLGVPVEEPEDYLYFGPPADVDGAAPPAPQRGTAEPPAGQPDAGARPGQGPPATRSPRSGPIAAAAPLPAHPGSPPPTPLSLEAGMMLRAKRQLLASFHAAVTVFVVCSVAATILPLFAGAAVGSVAIGLQNTTLYLMLVGLAYIFRLREESPYFLLPPSNHAGPGGGAVAHGASEASGAGFDLEPHERLRPETLSTELELMPIEDDEAEERRGGTRRLLAGGPSSHLPAAASGLTGSAGRGEELRAGQ